jgi:outer membrane protein assembly factor BamB
MAGIGIGVAVCSIRRTVHVASSSGKKAAGSGGAAKVRWDNVGGPPVAVTIANEDAVCGRTRAADQSDELAITCFDATTMKPRWTISGLGTYGGNDGYRSVHCASAADAMVVSDSHDQIRIFDLQTGHERAKLAATDHVERLCATGPHTVWARVADHHHLKIDVSSQAAGPDAQEPKNCDTYESAHVDQAGLKVPGFAAHQVWVDGELGVAGGYKSPGTRYPTAVGFDPKTLEVRWNIRLGANAAGAVQQGSNEHDVLAGGVYFTNYQVGSKGWHIAAFDAKTGAPLWDTALRNIFAVDSISAIIAGQHSLYVVRTSSLDVLDSKTGKVRGTIGEETYEDEH